MPKARSFPARLIAMVSVCVGCLPLVGCGGDAAPQRYNTELDLPGLQKREYDEAKNRESQSVIELLQSGTEGTSERIVGATELGEIIGNPTSATIKTP
jgi:hypothetical protein